jgi:hypothetical protein
LRRLQTWGLITPCFKNTITAATPKMDAPSGVFECSFYERDDQKNCLTRRGGRATPSGAGHIGNEFDNIPASHEMTMTLKNVHT